MTFQEIIRRLEDFWTREGCIIFQPYNSEVGAGTFNPATFLRILDKKPWNVAYVEIARRPRDGRYGKNPNRVQQYYQYQVIMKPAPEDIQLKFLNSLKILGIDLGDHEIRFVEDDWESPTLGASGLGWEVWLDGLEIVQFTYFQQAGGIELEVIPVELTYGLERIAMQIQEVDSIFDVKWSETTTWGDIYLKNEEEFSRYNFDEADIEFLHFQFEKFESEAMKLLEKKLVYPGYDCAIKCSHIFNLLEARGAISIQERTNLIGRVRKLAYQSARVYLEQENG
ncbi:MAG: glycine--tRNA ligase subunit alpha [candidate division WOR-3 bacterium]